MSRVQGAVPERFRLRRDWKRGGLVLEFCGIDAGSHQNQRALTSGAERIELVGGADAASPLYGPQGTPPEWGENESKTVSRIGCHKQVVMAPPKKEMTFPPLLPFCSH
jgi:hypothetical protein